MTIDTQAILEEITQLESKNQIKEALTKGKLLLSHYRNSKKTARITKNSLLLILARLSAKINSKECLQYCEEIYLSTVATAEEEILTIQATIMKCIYLLSNKQRVETQALLEELYRQVTNSHLLSIRDKEIFKATIAMHQGNAYLTLPTAPNLEAACLRYKLCLPVFRKYDQQRQLISTLLNYSGVTLELGNLTLTQEMLDEAIVLLEKEQNYSTLITTLIRKARLLESLSSYTDALKTLHDVLPIAKQYTPTRIPNIITIIQIICYAINLHQENQLFVVVVEKIMRYNATLRDDVMLFYAYYWAIHSLIEINNVEQAIALLEILKHLPPVIQDSNFRIAYLHLSMIVEYKRGHIISAQEFLHYMPEIPDLDSPDNIIIIMQMLSKADVLSMYNPVAFKDEIISIVQTIERTLPFHILSQKIAILQSCKKIYLQLTMPEDAQRIGSLLTEITPTVSPQEKFEQIKICNDILTILLQIQLDIADTALQQIQNSLKKQETSFTTLSSTYKKLQDGNTEFENIFRTLYRYLTTNPADIVKSVQLLTSVLEEKTPENNITNTSLPTTALPECPAELRTILLRYNKKLTPKELSFCFMTLEGYTIQQMSMLLQVSLAGVRKIRYRLARKLQCPANIVFYQFLVSITENQ